MEEGNGHELSVSALTGNVPFPLSVLSPSLIIGFFYETAVSRDLDGGEGYL